MLSLEKDHGCRPAQNNRLSSSDYGKWNSVFRRYRRWVTTDVFDTVQEILAEAVERDTKSDMIDSTLTPVNHYFIVIKKISGKRGVWTVA